MSKLWWLELLPFAHHCSIANTLLLRDRVNLSSTTCKFLYILYHSPQKKKNPPHLTFYVTFKDVGKSWSSSASLFFFFLFRSPCFCVYVYAFYYMLNPLNEKQYDWSVKMFWQGRTFFKCLREAVLISLLTYSWGATDILVYETFINRKTYWDNDKFARVRDRARWDTQTSTPVPILKSTKKKKKRKKRGWSKGIFWSQTLHSLTNLPHSALSA